MIVQVKNGKSVLLRKLANNDIDKLSHYLQNLGSESVKRYGPHGFDIQSISELYQNPDQYSGYIAEDPESSEIIAYSVIKTGYLEHDGNRLQSYGLIPDEKTDCTLAPSVADQWQSQGVGNSLFHFMRSDLKAKGFRRIILWGGVQSTNQKAVNYYLKNGFIKLGQFEHNGMNDDMILEIV
jgi:diamine N-acetyltransferase